MSQMHCGSCRSNHPIGFHFIIHVTQFIEIAMTFILLSHNSCLKSICIMHKELSIGGVSCSYFKSIFVRDDIVSPEPKSIKKILLDSAEHETINAYKYKNIKKA